MTAALFSGSLENLRVAVQDRLHQPYRMKFIPGFETVIRMSYELGSLGTYLSGAGPTMISIVDDEGVKIFSESTRWPIWKKWGSAAGVWKF